MSKTFFVTGATGLIGSELVRRLVDDGNHVVALVRDVPRAIGIFGSNKSITFIEGSLEEPISYSGEIHTIIHSASPTDSRFFVSNPVETIESVVLGTNNVMKLAVSKKVESFLYLSSMEVYGLPTNDIPIKEGDYSPISPTDVRSSYPIAKLLSENLSISYFSEYSVPVKVVRIAQVIGKKLIDGDNRAISQFVRAASKGEDINLATKGSSKQSYVSLSDTINALLLVASKGSNGEVYNISDESMYFSIKELAELVARVVSGGGVGVNIDPGADLGQYAAHRTLKLDSTKLRGLGWKPSVDIEAALMILSGSGEETE